MPNPIIDQIMCEHGAEQNDRQRHAPPDNERAYRLTAFGKGTTKRSSTKAHGLDRDAVGVEVFVESLQSVGGTG